MKDAYYFSHDSNARNDEKILSLRADYGLEGYGAFWILIEMMFENQNSSLSHKHLKGIAFTLNMKVNLLTKLIKSCIEYGLFISDGEYFWSESLRKRKSEFMNKRKKKVEAGKKSGSVRRKKSIESKEVELEISSEASQEKEMKVKEVKVKASLDFDKLEFLKDQAISDQFIAWIDYKGHKTYKRKNLPIVFKQLKDLSKGNPINAQKIVDQSIANGWSGMFPIKEPTGNYPITDYSKMNYESGEF